MFAGAWSAYLAVLYRAGAVRWKAWEHPLPADWSWSGFIQPPLFAEHQRWVERWSGSMDQPPEHLLVWLAAGMAPIVVLLAGWLAWRQRDHPGWAGYAALLMALSPTGLRPFEQYHAARLILALALVTTLHYALRGGRWRLGIAFAACILATQTHLSGWFVLGPMLVLLTWPLGECRRGLGALTIGLLLVFWALAQPNPLYGNALIDVFDQPTVRSRSIFSYASYLNPTFELSNRWLFLPLILWLVPVAWRDEARGLPLALGTACYVGAHLLLMRRGYALHWHAPEPHHYFELIEIAAVVGTTWLLAGAWRRWPGRRARVGVGLAAVAVLVTQGLGWLDVNEMIRR